jgi:hypothetical protein
VSRITADTITDEQIRALRSKPPTLDDIKPRGPAALSLVVRGFKLLCDDAIDGATSWLKREARARCAEILNARKEQSR